MKSVRILGVVALLAVASTMPACSLFTATPTASSQVLSEVRAAETAYLTAVTVINIRAKEANKPISPDVKTAENLVYAYIEAARAAAEKGDTVTVDAKLDLFNDALRKFNDDYVTPVPATQPK